MILVKLFSYLLYLWSDYMPNFYNASSDKTPASFYNLSYYNAYRLFATKTAYDQVRNREEVQEIKYPGCSVKQLYFLSRHGTRYPPTKGMTHMRDKLPLIRDMILKSVLKDSSHEIKLDVNLLHALKEWKFSFDPEFGMKLAPTGYNEYLELGVRLRQRYPFLVTKNFSGESFDIMFTSAERTKQSIHQLLVGLFDGKVDDTDILENGENDKLLRFYEICGKTSADSYEGVEEVTKFINGPEVATLLQNLTDRLELDYCPSFETVFMMYDICRYETALKPTEFSPWCALFQTEELKILEYSEDLESYYRSGYPYTIHYERACLIIKDLVDHFTQVAKTNKPDSHPFGVLRVSHSDLMLKTFARLGLFHDQYPLKANNYFHQEKRQWRCSLIDAFSSNIVFALMKCKSGFKVSSWFQEKEIRLPGCKDSPCSFDEFMKTYKPIAERCIISEACAMFDDVDSLSIENIYSILPVDYY